MSDQTQNPHDIGLAAMVRALESRNQLAAWTMLANAAGLFSTVSMMWSADAVLMPGFSRYVAFAFLLGMALGFLSRFFSVEMNWALSDQSKELMLGQEHPSRSDIKFYETGAVVCWVLSALCFAGTVSVAIFRSPMPG